MSSTVIWSDEIIRSIVLWPTCICKTLSRRSAEDTFGVAGAHRKKAVRSPYDCPGKNDNGLR
jgi:hypothetical protein